MAERGRVAEPALRGGTGRVRRAAQDLELELVWVEASGRGGFYEASGLIRRRLVAARGSQGRDDAVARAVERALVEASQIGKAVAMIGPHA